MTCYRVIRISTGELCKVLLIPSCYSNYRVRTLSAVNRGFEANTNRKCVGVLCVPRASSGETFFLFRH